MKITLDDRRLLARIAGHTLRRVPIRFRGKVPPGFVARCITGDQLTRLIALGWIEDVTPEGERERGEAVYRLSVSGPAAPRLAS